jgi:hypothetical protein
MLEKRHSEDLEKFEEPSNIPEPISQALINI